MDIGMFHTDDRLIHGQIITTWIAYAGTKTITVADGKAAKDEFQRSLLKVATPDSITLKIPSADDAIAYIQSGEGSGRVLLLMRGPEQALKFVGAGIEKDQVNVRNMNMRKGKTKVLGNLWVFPEDVEAIKGIYGHGARLGVQAVPNECSQDVMELLKKYGLT